MPHDDSSNPYAVNPSNLGFVEDLYLAYRSDRAAVSEEWAAVFAGYDRDGGVEPAAVNRARTGNGHTPAIAAVRAAPGAIAVVVAGETRTRGRLRKLIEDFREIGHMGADLDPLGLVDRSAQQLRPADYDLSDADMDTVIDTDVPGLATARLGDVIEHLRESYSRHIGVELGHLHDGALRGWLQERVERTRNRVALSRAEKMRLLGKVIEAEVFEQFLQNKFLGAKRFSLEGAESVIPLVDRVIDRAAAQGVTQVVIGMAHRGRLNMLANVFGKPAAEIFTEFLDKAGAIQWDPGGDVKYHLGHSSDRVTGNGRVHVSLAFNPSHLEAVNTVVQGRVRAKQDRMPARSDAVDPIARGLPILLHGDAAFAGQGVIYEGFNMSGLPGYDVGGTIHIVINNRIGFTTTPELAYAMTYPTDVARMLQVPIFHLNAEDPEAVAQVVDIAVDFRQQFHRDVVIDMWCYRKLGHNEGDEPGYTQPVMYRRIKDKAPVRDAFVRAFAATTGAGEAPITDADAEAVARARLAELDSALESAKSQQQPATRPTTFAGSWASMRGGSDAGIKEVATAVARESIEFLGRALSTVPADFVVHPKLERLLQARRAMALGEKPIDWGMGEALAFGSLLAEKTHVRMSGQDVRRGTFSHRHAVLWNFHSGKEYTPLQHLSSGQGTFDIHDSPLSEVGVLGFEFGYSLDAPDGLVLWEAQFGDFVNGAQVIIDQFLVSSEAKWRRVSGLVLLLPHGMEGQGPEHSSARLERFLNLCVNDNIQVCNVTTPAQFFHLLRRQVVRPYRKPLVVMSPKSLLRHPMAVSQLTDFTEGKFHHVLPDQETDPAGVDRIVLCSGKVYYDLVAARAEQKRNNVAIVRIEQFYPARLDLLLDALSVYRPGLPCVWVQEEGRNMGAWNFISRYFRPMLVGNFRFKVVSRPQSSSPATGSASLHKLEHAELMRAALGSAGTLIDG